VMLQPGSRSALTDFAQSLHFTAQQGRQAFRAAGR
jgi:hypothetical protein